MKPEYKPLQWVVFKVGDGHRVGQIMSAQEDGDNTGWSYAVTNGFTDRKEPVAEADITYVLMNGFWVDPSKPSGITDLLP